MATIRLAKFSLALPIGIFWPASFVPTANTTCCGLQANLQAMLLNVPPDVEWMCPSLETDRSPSTNGLHWGTEKMAT